MIKGNINLSSITKENIIKLCQIAEDSAISGGRHIKSEYFSSSSELSIKEKKKDDFVTNLDVESENIIRSIIKKNNPNARIIGEEGGEEGTDSLIWFVDPLDGTGAFIRGNLGFVSVSVAVFDSNTNEVLAGAIYNPFTEMLYSASTGESSKLNKNSNLESSSKSLAKAKILLDISEKHPFELRKALSPDNSHLGRILRYDGSFAQHMCLIASGALDGGIFWGTGDKGTFWDLAAALIICKEAGLKVTDLLGNDLSYSSPFYDQIIVGPVKLHSDLLRWVKLVSDENNIKINQDLNLNKPSKKKKTKKKAKKKKVSKKKKAKK